MIRSVCGSWVICVIRLQMLVFRQPAVSVISTSSPGPKLPHGAFGWLITTAWVTVSMFIIEVSTLCALAAMRGTVLAVWSV